MTDLAGFWRHTPRLTALAVAVLLIAGGLMALASENAYRDERAGDVEVQARILAATVTAALSFNDRTAAGEYVAALSASPEFEAAGVYDANPNYLTTTDPSVYFLPGVPGSHPASGVLVPVEVTWSPSAPLFGTWRFGGWYDSASTIDGRHSSRRSRPL